MKASVSVHTGGVIYRPDVVMAKRHSRMAKAPITTRLHMKATKLKTLLQKGLKQGYFDVGRCLIL